MELSFPIQDPLLQVALLLALVLIVELTLDRLHLPALLGLLVAGMLLGPDGLGAIPREPVVSLLGDIGLVYLMFMAALEIDLDVLRDHRREALVFGTATFLFTLVPAVAVGMLFGYGWAAAVLVGALISSHTLIAYPIVHAQGIHQRKPVVTAIGGTLVTDTAALMVLVVVVQVAGANSDGRIAGVLIPLGLLSVLVAVSLGVLPRASRAFLGLSRLTPAERALYVLAVLVALAVIADLIGTEKILGAFLAGVCLNRVLATQDALREHVEFAGRLLFIPFFYVSMGMLLPLEIFTGAGNVWLLAVALLAVVLTGKSAAAWAVGQKYGYTPWFRGVMIGLTIPQAAATLAIASRGVDEGVFELRVVDAVIIVIFVSCLAGPLLVGYAGRKVRGTLGSHYPQRTSKGLSDP